MPLNTLAAAIRACTAVGCLHLGPDAMHQAAKRPGDNAELLCPGQPWSDIRRIGNLCGMLTTISIAMLIWKVFEDDLPPLKATVSAALQRLLGADQT
jgi:hypothetical protein